jgi:hypothetical protein
VPRPRIVEAAAVCRIVLHLVTAHPDSSDRGSSCQEDEATHPRVT